MSDHELKNKPLVEAIFEMRWELEQRQPGFAVDPHYRLLLGRLYDKLREGYPEHEQLESANVPDEMVPHVVQHRFRVGKNDWPLIQLGPGVFTVNDTEKYRWEDFRPRVCTAVTNLREAHPKQDALKVKSLMLRYVDAVDFDHAREDAFPFLRDNLKVGVTMPTNLFENTDVDKRPQQFRFQQGYRSSKPAGVIRLSIATGHRRDRPAIIWETTLQSTDGDVPSITESFDSWLDQSHMLVNDWFFKMIEGDLHGRFSGD